jgi:hydrogenase/urease accessory protein HupE
MNRKIIIGILLGTIAGVLDVIPMVLQKLTWDANFSAFSMWVVVGFLISISELRIPTVLKGILTSFLVLLPCAIIIGSKEPMSLVPIGIMTLVLGGILGISIEKFGKKT